MVGDSGAAGSNARPLVGRGGDAQPVRNHVSETKRATRASPGLVRGEGELAKRRALICAFDNAGFPCSLYAMPAFRRIENSCRPKPARRVGIVRENLEMESKSTNAVQDTVLIRFTLLSGS